MTTSEPIKFISPQPNAALIWWTQRFSGLFAAAMHRFRVVLEPGDRQRLRALAQGRVLYLPNHPSHADGITLFVLSAQARQSFYYIAAYESFRGWMGRVMALLGVYSIRRGVGDRPSIAETLRLMEQPDCKLVMFPEGGCSYQNDTVMPFREGAVGLALRTLKKLALKSDPVPDFYLVPVSLKYQHRQAMDRAIGRSLRQLEQALGVPQRSPDFYWRLRTVAGTLLLRLEAEFGIQPQPMAESPALASASNWNQRIDQLKNTMLLTYEGQVGLPPQPHLPMRERVYKVQAQLEERYEALSAQGENGVKGVPDAIAEAEAEKLYTDTLRLLNFDAIYDHYVAENPTQERFLDILTKMEREVFRIETPRPKGLRLARIKVGAIINLKDYLDEYRHDRDATVQKLTQLVQHTVQANVLALDRNHHPPKLLF
ncbi:MAG: 1-acyl-sn-glycerol-3-phosphate acyltransferase [Nodosilinea sp.]